MRDEAERTAAEIKAYMATRDELLRGAKLANRTAQRHPQAATIGRTTAGFTTA
jgi:nitric oxide synthase oxygenase domain/subunit